MEAQAIMQHKESSGGTNKNVSRIKKIVISMDIKSNLVQCINSIPMMINFTAFMPSTLNKCFFLHSIASLSAFVSAYKFLPLLFQDPLMTH